MSTMVTTTEARVGDAVEVKGLPGNPAKRGQILEVLGAGEHVHFSVRWEDGHESRLFPTAEGGTLIHRPAHETSP
jgi:archaeosine-15-forming tRNA-guanine transglycosylase